MALAAGLLAAISSELALRVVAHTRLAIAGRSRALVDPSDLVAGRPVLAASIVHVVRPAGTLAPRHGAARGRLVIFLLAYWFPRFDAAFTRADGSLGAAEFKNGPGAAVNPRQGTVAQDRGRSSSDRLPICGRRE